MTQTRIKITVTAYVTSKEADAEKSASVTAVIDDTGRAHNDWGGAVAKLISEATEIGHDFPFHGAKLMTPKAVDKYLEAQAAE
jgi:hypothetical protein